MPMETVTVGRIVHFSYPDDSVVGEVYPLMCHAAIVTRVVDAGRGIVNLQWFDDNSRHTARNVLQSQTDRPVENTWHWPERA